MMPYCVSVSTHPGQAETGEMIEADIAIAGVFDLGQGGDQDRKFAQSAIP
jgi:hypothetical protein